MAYFGLFRKIFCNYSGAISNSWHFLLFLAHLKHWSKSKKTLRKTLRSLRQYERKLVKNITNEKGTT